MHPLQRRIEELEATKFANSHAAGWAKLEVVRLRRQMGVESLIPYFWLGESAEEFWPGHWELENVAL